MKVYDCFAFFNELDLLKLRLEELDPVVDHFVIVEATRTFQKDKKPLYFSENKDLFSKFSDKIIHIVVDKYPTIWTKFRPVTPWHYDNHQKQQAIQGLEKAQDDDIILFSDIDEIPSAQAVTESLSSDKKIKVFELYQSLYFLNNVCTKIYDYDGKAVAQRNRAGFGRWRGPVLSQYKNIKNFKKFRMIRDQESEDIQVIQDAGWHLTSMGGIEKIIYKMKSYTHPEYSTEEYASQKNLAKCILEGTDHITQKEKYQLYDITDPQIPFLSPLKRDPTPWSHMIKTKDEIQSMIQNLI